MPYPQHIVHQKFPDFQSELSPSPKSFKKGDIVLFYFSAHWCPPCKQFTPMLKAFVNKFPGNYINVVFVSSDKSDQQAVSYWKEMHHEDSNYLLPNESSNHELNSFCGVSGIPHLCCLENPSFNLVQPIMQFMSSGSWDSSEITKVITGIVHPRVRLAIGQMVRIEGLKNASQHNGKFANVEGYKEDRYVVNMDDDGKLALKRLNLKVFNKDSEDNFKVGKCGYTHGLSVEDKNGLECELIEFKKETGRWLVKIFDNEQLSLKPEKIKF